MTKLLSKIFLFATVKAYFLIRVDAYHSYYFSATMLRINRPDGCRSSDAPLLLEFPRLFLVFALGGVLRKADTSLYPYSSSAIKRKLG